MLMEVEEGGKKGSHQRQPETTSTTVISICKPLVSKTGTTANTHGTDIMDEKFTAAVKTSKHVSGWEG